MRKNILDTRKSTIFMDVQELLRAELHIELFKKFMHISNLKTFQKILQSF